MFFNFFCCNLFFYYSNHTVTLRKFNSNSIKEGQLFLINADISNYDKASSYSKLDSKRVRKLLVHKKEISKLQGKIEKEGMTIVPLKLYFNNKGIAKVEIAVAKGKKLYDKREVKKKKDWNIQKKRLLKNIN